MPWSKEGIFNILHVLVVFSPQLSIMDLREQKLNIIFSLIAFSSSWVASYLSTQLIKIFVLQIRTYPWQHIAICSSHRIGDFSSVPCNTNSSWTASRATLSSPKNYSWKDHHNNISNSSISKPLAYLGLKVKKQTFKFTKSLGRRALRDWRSASAYLLWGISQRATSLSIQIQFLLSWILIIKLKPIFFTSPDTVFLPIGKFQALSQLFRWHFHRLLCCKTFNF